MPILFALLIGVLCGWSAEAVRAEPSAGALPTEAFSSLPLLRSIQLSPSGRHLAVLRHHEGRTYLDTQTVTGQEPHRAASTDNLEFAIDGFRWVNDERLLVSIRVVDQRQGIDRQETRLLAVNRDGTQLNDNLLQRVDTPSPFTSQPAPHVHDRIVGTIPGDPRHVLMALDLDRPNSPDVYRLDVYTGRREIVQVNPGLQPGPRNILQWMADRQGQVRAGIGQFGTVVHVIAKAPGSNDWRMLAEYDSAKETGLVPLAFDADPNWLYVRDQHRGKAAVFKVNLAGDPSIDRMIVASDPEFDLMGDVVYVPGKQKVVGARYSADDRRVLFWDFDAQRLQARIDRALPDRANVIQSSSDDGRLHIVKSAGPAYPPEWSLFDERDGRMVLLGRSYPALEPRELSPSKRVAITARDGRDLFATLTLPKGKAPRELPLILFPHGGPAAHEREAFNYWTQWFASRGWAVLEMRFRGIPGYGDDYLRAGFQRWGLEMQDDLTDGAQWAIHEGLASAHRICVVGSGYGGYAALMGLVTTPTLYRCAVSLGGVSDVLPIVDDGRWYLNRRAPAETKVGGWWNDRDRLTKASPLFHVAEITGPLLMLHGAMDRVVPVSQSRRFAEAMRKAQAADFRYVELPLADHRLTREPDRRQVFSELEAFLSSHLD